MKKHEARKHESQISNHLLEKATRRHLFLGRPCGGAVVAHAFNPKHLGGRVGWLSVSFYAHSCNLLVLELQGSEVNLLILL